MLARLLYVLLQKLLRRIPRLVRVESLHVQEEGTFPMILLQPGDRLPSGLLRDGVSFLKPAFAIRGVLIQECVKCLAAGELFVQFRLTQILGWV